MLISNQSCSLPQNPLRSLILLPHHQPRKSISLKNERSRANKLSILASKPNGKMRSPPRQVHGMLAFLQRRHRPQRYLQLNSLNKNKKNNPIRRLVPHRLQSRNQLPTTHSSSRRWPRKSNESLLHDKQHHRHSLGIFKNKPQIRSHVRKESLRALVRRLRNVVRLIFLSKRRSSSPLERLRLSRSINPTRIMILLLLYSKILSSKTNYKKYKWIANTTNWPNPSSKNI